MKGLSRELAEAKREAQQGRLVPLPGESVESCALELGATSKTVGSSMAQLLTAANQGGRGLLRYCVITSSASNSCYKSGLFQLVFWSVILNHVLFVVKPGFESCLFVCLLLSRQRQLHGDSGSRHSECPESVSRSSERSSSWYQEPSHPGIHPHHRPDCELSLTPTHTLTPSHPHR